MSLGGASVNLKSISKEAIPAALERAQRYRMLDEPPEAESICLDVLAIDPQNHEALVILLLALTDQFEHRQGAAVKEAREVLRKMKDEYSRQYYEGVICERWAKANLLQDSPRAPSLARGWLSDALACYERAEKLRPAGNDESILRWNTCQRLLSRLAEPAVTAAPPMSDQLE